MVVDRLNYFTIELLSTEDILKGELSVDKYDVLIYTPDQADLYLSYTGLKNLPKNKIRVREIKKFVENGGGYYGYCGAALIAGDMINKPETLGERSMKRSCFGISCFNVEYHTDIPIITQIMGRDASTISQNAYLFNSGWGAGPHLNFYSGIPVDCNISKDNPIFDDIIGETRRINWIGAPAFIPTEETDRETMILAKFPEVEFSDNETLNINHWKYIGGLVGLIKAFIHPGTGGYWSKNPGRLTDAWVFAEDWVNTGQVVETDVANKPFMTAEIYPNSNQARIVGCSGHPEFNVLWGGHIEDVEDNDNNSLYEGFYKWVNVTPSEETIEDEKTYNYCIVRRIIAWASQKVPDNDLPPIYGPSQVSDIYPYEQPSSFNLIGNAEKADGIESLDLYYNYSIDNKTWANKIFYGKDSDGSDGWNWEFNSPNGTGFYQFYSIRNVEYEGHTETETVPPGPDAIAYVSN